MMHAGLHNGLKIRCFVGSIPARGTKIDNMKTHRITIKESDWNDSKYKTKEWEIRVNIARWEHDYVNKVYHIDIKIK
jgi:hypothetical protein